MKTQPAILTDQTCRSSIQFLEALTASYGQKNFAVRLWDGTLWGDIHEPRFTLVLKHPGALKSMFTSPNELTLGEAFIYDDFDIEGNIEAAFDFADYLLNRDYSITEKLKFGAMLALLPSADSRSERTRGASLKGKMHSKDRDKSAILITTTSPMTFTHSGSTVPWFTPVRISGLRDDLDTTQARKLDYICRRLRLRPGDRMLDLGCGWGGLLMHAVKNYGVDAFGITLSVAQAELARERIRLAGLADHCKVEVCDYRDLEPSQRYDKIVSVGMFEHVGERLLPEYFQRAWQALRPGGVFLNHGIASSATFESKGPSFTEKYVFPDGELVPLNGTLRAAEACGFEVRDV